MVARDASSFKCIPCSEAFYTSNNNGPRPYLRHPRVSLECFFNWRHNSLGLLDHSAKSDMSPTSTYTSRVLARKIEWQPMSL